MIYKQSELPVLWVLHNMPRSGGTLLSKCLGSMDSHVLLSEIHPDAQHVLSFNALGQAQQWHNLLPELDWQKTPFKDAIKQLQNTAVANKRKLILRDWSHVDYLGPPVTTDPSQRPALLDTLSPYFEIKTIQLVRHPLDTWLSLRRLNLIKKHNIGIEQFLSAYRTYLDMTQANCRLIYEDFLKAPTSQLKKVCAAVGLSYDDGYQERWFDFDKITGDTSNRNSLREVPTIRFRPRRDYDDIDEQWLNQHKDYCYLVSSLYPDQDKLG